MSMNCSQNMNNDENNQLLLYRMIVVWNISTFLYNIERIFTNGPLRLQWLNGTGSWCACVGPYSHQLAGRDFFVPWLAAKSQEPMTIAGANGVSAGSSLARPRHIAGANGVSAGSSLARPRHRGPSPHILFLGNSHNDGTGGNFACRAGNLTLV